MRNDDHIYRVAMRRALVARGEEQSPLVIETGAHTSHSEPLRHLSAPGHCPTIRLSTGGTIDLLKPNATDIDIEHIAHALANICRFTGHTDEFYSVAQHSVLVSDILDPQFKMAGLLHDSSEAFLGDVSKPLKNLLPEYMKIEAHMETVVLQRFGITERMDTEVKWADLVLLVTEQRDLLGEEGWIYQFKCETFERPVMPLPWFINPLPPNEAKELFLKRYEQLRQGQTDHFIENNPGLCSHPTGMPIRSISRPG
jgi:hypothetical protein